MKKSSPSAESGTAAHQYAQLYDAPEAWRKLNEVPLTLEQVNEIVLRAQELGTETAINIGAARGEFRETNEVVNNQWVRRTKKKE